MRCALLKPEIGNYTSTLVVNQGKSAFTVDYCASMHVMGKKDSKNVVEHFDCKWNSLYV